MLAVDMRVSGSKEAMKRKLIILVCTILILLVSTVLAGCGRNDMIDPEAIFYFPGSSEIGNINDLSLTIYHKNFFVLSDPVG
jgi:hypothetical protein